MPAPRQTYSRESSSSSRPDTSQGLDRSNKVPGAVEAHSAREAYDRFAPVYDEFNAGNDYEHWLGELLLPELEKHGLRDEPPRKVLDVGCGTGRAFRPLLTRGWEVWGCDVSEEMLARVDLRPHGLPWWKRAVAVWQADARELPEFSGSFDLILALNDVVNYLTEDGDLERFFEGVKRNLAPGGLVCFDANCLSLFEANWIAGRESDMSERGWEWTGLSEEVVAGETFEVELSGDGIETHRHRQRHWTREQIEGAMASPGLRLLAVLGQTENESGIVLDDPPDEHRHLKTIYIGAHGG